MEGRTAKEAGRKHPQTGLMDEFSTLKRPSRCFAKGAQGLTVRSLASSSTGGQESISLCLLFPMAAYRKGGAGGSAANSRSAFAGKCGGRGYSRGLAVLTRVF